MNKPKNREPSSAKTTINQIQKAIEAKLASVDDEIV